MSERPSSKLSLKIVSNGVEIRFGDGSENKEVLPVHALPKLVEELLRAGRPVLAVAVSDAWFVALANAYGYPQYVLDGGRRNG